MDAIHLIYIAIVAIIICLIVTVSLLLAYSGLFHSFDVGAGTPPIGQVTVAYKFIRGQYKEAGQLFTETLALAPDQKTIGVYYDNPKEVELNETRYIVGSILAEGEEIIDEALKKKMLDEGYSMTRFPAVSNAVKTTFPHKCTLSIFIAVARVYPRLGVYIEDHKLCAHPMIEIYDGTNIYFMAPLSKQEEFCVPEVRSVTADESIASDETGTDMTEGEIFRLGEFANDTPSPYERAANNLETAIEEESALIKEEPLRETNPEEEDLIKGDNSDQNKDGGTCSSMNDSGVSSETPHLPDLSSDSMCKNGAGEMASDHSTGSGSSFEEIHLDTQLVDTPLNTNE